LTPYPLWSSILGSLWKIGNTGGKPGENGNPERNWFPVGGGKGYFSQKRLAIYPNHLNLQMMLSFKVKIVKIFYKSKKF
jgi:hypothetical protein